MNDMPLEAQAIVFGIVTAIILAIVLLVIDSRPELGDAVRRWFMSREERRESSETQVVHVPGPRTETPPGGTPQQPRFSAFADRGLADTDAVPGGTTIPPNLTRLDDATMVILLAMQRTPAGAYRYSANAIFGLVGGSRADVLAQIRAVRDNTPAVYPARTPEQQAARAELGLDRR